MHTPHDESAGPDLSASEAVPLPNESDLPLLNGMARACDRLDMSRSTLYRFMQSGEIRYMLIGGRRFIPEPEMLRFRDSHRLENAA